MHRALTLVADRHGLPREVRDDLADAVTMILNDARDTVLLPPTDVVPVRLEPMPATTGEPEGDGGPRYRDLGRLAEGAMGEIHRVHDRELGRVVVRKVLRQELLAQPELVARFLEEAQVAAQLQHPALVPVHDVGRLPDGRFWFTMREVHGRTFGDELESVHARSAAAGEWVPSGTGVTFRRLVEAFRTVCEGMAYAHARGVVHRDLKPDNVMLGAYGEVYVLDWGLARVRDRPDRVGAGPEGGVRTSSARETRAGTILGTPTYMAPEQARGEHDRIDARTDVYALGAILYHLLSGRPPYEGPDGRAVWRSVLDGPPPPISGGRSPEAPAELVAVCERAMARAREDRFASAAELAAEVGDWLEGSRRRERALGIVAEADALAERAAALLARAGTLRDEGQRRLGAVPRWAPEEDKAPAWNLLDEAARTEREASQLAAQREALLRGALTHAPDLAEAHERLVALELDRHRRAEEARDVLGAGQAAVHLREHARALPEAHPVRRRATAWLRGDGALTLVTDPPGAEVHVVRYVEHHRRLVERTETRLGPTPLHAVPLPMGSYVCVLRHPDRGEVRYPVVLGRSAHWDGVPPGGDGPEPVRLPLLGELAADEVYVPPGPFEAGGDPEALAALPRTRAWCHAFVMQRFPVTNRQYLTFLQELVAAGREEEALRFAPRDRAAVEGQLGALLYGYEHGRFFLQADGEGDTWDPEHPVVSVGWHGARAYLAWRAARTGRRWRLPCELEWEKAARGVDGRRFPWGDHFDPSWCCSVDRPGRPVPVPIESYPVDASPYGVRGLGGNVQDWCLDPLERKEPHVDGGRVVVPRVGDDDADTTPRILRGGAWFTGESRARCANRMRAHGHFRDALHGFRGVYEP